ncbi:MAG: electron transport complex subunit E [Porticoccaceae bacterium]|nr:MAG: electron transport complex subunit E [Porticoccaceae bacterium]
MADQPGRVAAQGLWHNNPALVQLLGLCPLLAVSGSVVNALGLGLATLFVLTASNLTVSLIRRVVPDAVRIPVFVMVIATLVTCVELLMRAFTYELYQILGIFIPLIVTNCVILGRAESFASRNPVGLAALDGFAQGLGFALVIVAVGAIRELLGNGTLFANMALLLGPPAADWEIRIAERGLLVAVLPPGAFLVVGLLIALKHRIDTGLKARAAARGQAAPAASRRVRTTGAIH